MVYHKRPCDPTARAPLPGDLRHHVLDRRLPRDPARARAGRRARGLAGRARRRRLRICAHGGRHSDRSLPHAPPEARGRGRPVRARRGRPRPHGGRDVPRPRARSAPDGRGPRARDGGRAHGDPPLPHRLEPRLGAQRVRVLGDDRHPLRHGAGRGAAIEPQLEPGAAGHVRPAAPRHPDAPRAPPRALRPRHGRLDAAARRAPARDAAGARRLADRPLPRVRGWRHLPRPLPRGAPRRGPRPDPHGCLGRGACPDGPALPPARKETTMNYADYRHLVFDLKPNGVLVITINRPEVMNATNARLHWELTQVWLTVDADPQVRVALVTGAGKAFSAGGDLSLVEEMAGNPDAMARTMREASDLVYNMINLDKPVVSAINGAAVGAGLVVALLADVSIISATARLTDGHTRLGVAAGDHAAIIWPLLCGMAKAKYYLLTADFLDGQEAERIGLVSLCVPADQVLPKAVDVAGKLAQGSQLSIRWTKRALNNWLRQAGPIFDQSLALEMLTFMHPDVREGARAIREKRAPAARGPASSS